MRCQKNLKWWCRVNFGNVIRALKEKKDQLRRAEDATFRRKHCSSSKIKERDQLTFGQGRKKRGNNVLVPDGYMRGIKKLVTFIVKPFIVFKEIELTNWSMTKVRFVVTHMLELVFILHCFILMLCIMS